MKNRIILVTGANRGIGLAITKELSKNKSDTILLGCRNLADGTKIAKDISDNVHAVALDLSGNDILETNLNGILEKYPNIDVLINNAGVLFEGQGLSMHEDQIKGSLWINTVAPLWIIRKLAPSMKKQNYGRIINISSGYGAFSDGLAGPFAYSLSKAALNAMTLAISREFGENVKINTMCPGWVRTRMGGSSAPRSVEQGAETAVWLANIPENGPNGKFFRDKKEIPW